MDISIAASMFDDQPIYDGYTNDLLFVGQPVNYDGSVRDSVASWRESLSAAEIILPSRGIVLLGAGKFITGKVLQDFFQGDVVRENVILHPCDGLYSAGSAADFLTSPLPSAVIPFFGSVAWRKVTSDDKESPEYHNVCDIYFSPTEGRLAPDSLILAANGIMYRVRSIEDREGGFLVAVCSELGFNTMVNVAYNAKGTYNSVTDSFDAGTIIATRGVLELTKTNFKFLVADTAKYESGDRIITVKAIDIPQPKTEDVIEAVGVSYRIISVQLDNEGSCWELHCRRS